jgi:ATP-dependent helicase/DNAse subunit B
MHKRFWLEQTFERILNHPTSFPVLIKGNVDRIEERNGVIRIIDYKLESRKVKCDVKDLERINRGD